MHTCRAAQYCVLLRRISNYVYARRGHFCCSWCGGTFSFLVLLYEHRVLFSLSLCISRGIYYFIAVH